MEIVKSYKNPDCRRQQHFRNRQQEGEEAQGRLQPVQHHVVHGMDSLSEEEEEEPVISLR